MVISVSGLLIPEPTYSGPDNVVYFRGASGLEEELNRDKKTVWLVAFYTVWNPACVTLAPIYAQMSTQYSLANLKFGKVDVGRYPDAGQKYHVNDSSMSKQLPTLVLFKDGKEYMRRPTVDSKGKLIKFVFSPDNIKATFDLNNLHETSKGSLKTKAHEKSD